jgi:hypothetical protein
MATCRNGTYLSVIGRSYNSKFSELYAGQRIAFLSQKRTAAHAAVWFSAMSISLLDINNPVVNQLLPKPRVMIWF